MPCRHLPDPLNAGPSSFISGQIRLDRHKGLQGGVPDKVEGESSPLDPSGDTKLCQSLHDRRDTRHRCPEGLWLSHEHQRSLWIPLAQRPLAVDNLAQGVLPIGEVGIRLDVHRDLRNCGQLQFLTRTELPVQGGGLHPETISNSPQGESLDALGQGRVNRLTSRERRLAPWPFADHSRPTSDHPSARSRACHRSA